MARGTTRKLRIASELHQLLDHLLRTEARDPRLERVRINSVEVSGDFSIAKVYFGNLDPDEDPTGAEEALLHAAGFFRSRLGRELRLRRVPELRFIHDDSIRRGLALTHLIDDAAGLTGGGSQRPTDESCEGPDG
jgi:ribosome-binding factor A